MKVNDAMFSSILCLKLSFLSCSLAIVCRSESDVNASVHDLRYPNDEKKSRSKTLLRSGSSLLDCGACHQNGGVPDHDHLN